MTSRVCSPRVGARVRTGVSAFEKSTGIRATGAGVGSPG